jgi:hypothetical protein
MSMALYSDSISSDPNTVLSTASFTDVTLLSHSIATNTASSSSINLGLVLGVAIPLGILCTIYVI